MTLPEVLTILTPAESRLFPLLLTGKTTDQIAKELGVNTRNVLFHSSQINKKLKVKGRIELMSKFVNLKRMDEGLVQTVLDIKNEIELLKETMRNVLPGGLISRDKNRV
ncbi:MAG: helix-turn-helix transcriptional regulator [Parachlamydiaceae bacterium]